MTRREAYAEGFAEGCRWAEQDARDGVRLDPDWVMPQPDASRAFTLGRLRGYRDTWARIDAGTLTRSMFELGPVNR